MSKIKKTDFRIIALVAIAILLIFFAFCLPFVLFKKPTSTILLDRDGELLSACIAEDGQWRFPAVDSVPEKFRDCIIQFEDRHFEEHPGVYLPSMIRAIGQNISAGRVVSGGSTLTMQVVRLSRDNPDRTLWEKFTEVIRAVRLETRFSKGEILSLYASHAPFGGNVVGLEAASWRYYGRQSSQLSWAESATLAVLPNAPALIYPGKNQELLLAKRNRLLESLWRANKIDSLTCALSKSEPLPGPPKPLPQMANHLMLRTNNESGKGKAYHSTLDRNIQLRATSIIQRHADQLARNQIHNAACIIIEVKTMDVLAYIGNVNTDESHAPFVDLVNSPRSTGSILKPFLYASMLDDGEILPNTLFPDIPTNIGGYSPKNFDEKFRGAVPANEALSLSLNIPAVRMLRRHGIDKFHYRLQKIGLHAVNRSPSHYGLSLILGGAESTLWEISRAYAGMSASLGRYKTYNGKYDQDIYRSLNYLDRDTSKSEVRLEDSGVISAAAIYQTLDAMQEVHRPESELGWETFESSKKVAWKTGTSFGNRDAWAIGVTPEYVVGVWVGNADGEGRPGLTGVTAAAPILFELTNMLPGYTWFDPPYDEMERIAVCPQSGHRISENCPVADTVWIARNGLRTTSCPYHMLVHLDRSGYYRVNSTCYSPSFMVTQSRFVLPPIQEWYYKNYHPSYSNLPKFLPGCLQEEHTLALIYPRGEENIYLPKTFEANRGKLLCEASHRDRNATLFWHLDNTFVGSTREIHYLEIQPGFGDHTLTIVDENGNSVQRAFKISSGENP